MRFYHVQPQQHYFCGIDLHTQMMYLNPIASFIKMLLANSSGPAILVPILQEGQPH